MDEIDLVHELTRVLIQCNWKRMPGPYLNDNSFLGLEWRWLISGFRGVSRFPEDEMGGLGFRQAVRKSFY